MRGMTSSTRKGRGLLCLALWLMATMALGVVESADDSTTQLSPRSEEPRIVVQVRGWWAQLRNSALDYAFVSQDSGALGGEVRSLEFDREAALRIYAGWRFPSPGAPLLGAEFWTLETESSDSTGLRTRQIGALLSVPQSAFAISRGFADSAVGRSKIAATQIDLGLTWTPELGERFGLSVTSGIRAFRYEESSIVTYSCQCPILGGTASIEEVVVLQTDRQGIGPRGQVAFHYRFARRFRTGVRVGLAFPVGDLESFQSNTEFIEGVADDSFVVDRRGTRQVSRHLELGMDLEARLWKGLTLSVGYDFQEWSDVRMLQRMVNPLGGSGTISEEASVVFEGPYLELRYEF